MCIVNIPFPCILWLNLPVLQQDSRLYSIQPSCKDKPTCKDQVYLKTSTGRFCTTLNTITLYSHFTHPAPGSSLISFPWLTAVYITKDTKEIQNIISEYFKNLYNSTILQRRSLASLSQWTKKIETEVALSDYFYESSITPIPKPNYNTKKKSHKIASPRNID